MDSHAMKVTTPKVLIQTAQRAAELLKPHNKQLAQMFPQCYLNTIETTVKKLKDGSCFVITGDIPAMWLRDSSAQLKPYIRFVTQDPELDEIIESVIHKQAEYVNLDPYANAFNYYPRGFAYDDDTFEHPMVWERKYEVDSLCSVIELAYEYYQVSNNSAIFDDAYKSCLMQIYAIFKIEQNHKNSPYRFERRNPPALTDTLPHEGCGNPVGYTGMTWSGFRPSDDACTYGYLIPANMMAVVALRHACEILNEVYKDNFSARKFAALEQEIDSGIKQYGIVENPTYGKIYAYEVDGLGNALFMDDANSPSLMAMPYIGYCTQDDEIYQNTRNFILSKDNPYFYTGSAASGIGSPHTPSGYVWHISLIMQILTSANHKEIEKCLSMIAATDAQTGFIHESFCANDPTQYTRPWFAWANTLFAQMLLKLLDDNYF